MSFLCFGYPKKFVAFAKIIQQKSMIFSYEVPQTGIYNRPIRPFNLYSIVLLDNEEMM